MQGLSPGRTRTRPHGVSAGFCMWPRWEKTTSGSAPHSDRGPAAALPDCSRRKVCELLQRCGRCSLPLPACTRALKAKTPEFRRNQEVSGVVDKADGDRRKARVRCRGTRARAQHNETDGLSNITQLS